MEIDRERLEAAVGRGVLTRAQADALWRELARSPAPQPAARASREAARTALLAAGVAAVAVAVAAGWRAAGVADAPPPADLAALAVHPGFLGAALVLAAAAAAFAIARVPALAAIVVAAAWGLAQSAAPAAFGPEPTWSQRALLSALVGLGALGAGVALDRRTRRDVAGGLYLAGLLALCGGLATYRSAGPLALALHAALDVALFGYALALERRVFAVFGALGLAGVAGRLAERALEPWAFALALAAIAAALAAGGLAWHRHARRWSRALARRAPERIRRLLPPGAGS